MVVSIAGGIDHQEAVDSLIDAFGSWQSAPPQKYVTVENGQSQARSELEHRKTEQAHLCLALPGLSVSHPDRFTLDLLNVILGEGMSSRLFVEIREKRGLAYAIQSFVNHHLDTGSLTVYAGVDPASLPTAVTAILAELARLKEEIPEIDLVKAKELCKGRLLLRMEDTRSVAGWLGGQELLLGEILNVDEIVSIIDSIEADDLLRVARKLFITDKLNLAVVGPMEEKQLEGLLHL